MKKSKNVKLQLSDLKVQSFVTVIDKDTKVQGLGGEIVTMPQSIVNHSTCRSDFQLDRL